VASVTDRGEHRASCCWQVPEGGTATHRHHSESPPKSRSVNERLPPTLRTSPRRTRWLSEDTPVVLANGSHVRIPLKGGRPSPSQSLPPLARRPAIRSG
jgi:hypothetical protein